MAVITIEALRRIGRALEAQYLAPVIRHHYVAVVHPDVEADLRRASVRQQWYAQHRENRLAKREGRAPRDIARLYQHETGRALGIHLIVDGGRP